MKGRTSVTIAHRLSTVIDSDIIYFIDKGQIIAKGNHKYLIDNCSHYASLCKVQFQQKNID